MQYGPALVSGSLISDRARILDLVYQDAFYAVYLAEATESGAKAGITEYFPADLVIRAPNGDVALRSLELRDLFNAGRERFLAEARALSALRHPNLLRFDGVISDHSGVFALHGAEEGQTFTIWARQAKRQLSQEDIDAGLKPLLSALDLLHSKGLIHANITPDAILLRPEPLLIRFGGARSFLAARMRKVNLAVTPGYSAPELHFSDESAHGPLCDVFSLAAVLYFAVTGRHPINVIARGLGQTMPPAAAMSGERFRPEFLEAIDKGLELEPERRPPTIAAFGGMLLGAERSAPDRKLPALQAAEQGEGDPKAPLPQEGSPDLPSSSRLKTFRASSPPAGYGGSEYGGRGGDEDGDDEEEEDEDGAHDAGGWSGGLGKILIAAGVFALFVLGGFWFLEAQFAKEPQQAAQADLQKAALPPVPNAAQDAAGQPPAASILPGWTAALKQQEGSAEPTAPARPAGEPSTDVSREAANAMPQEAPPPEPFARRPPDAPPPREADNEKAAVPAPPQAPPSETLVPEDKPVEVAKVDPAPWSQPLASASSPPGFKFKDCDVCPPLVVVPAGEFIMGSNERPLEKPAHKVKIASPFAIGQFEVTHAEWEACVQAGACRSQPGRQGASTSEPVGNLSWEDARVFLKWLSEKTGQSYRLPSEAEWEYAARAGSKNRFWWGNEEGLGNANCAEAKPGSKAQPEAAGTYKANPFGLYDTAGNLAEWVQDCWNETYQGAPADGSAWTKGNCALRGLRGGSFGNKPAFCRSSARFRYDADVPYDANGFRVVRELR